MNDFLDRITKLSPKRLALLAVELQRKLDATQDRRREPIAIIGLGCRFPGGADGPDAYWKLLSEGRDAIKEVPSDRWDIDAFYDPDPERPGKMSTRWGGFLESVDRFEPQFFGIAPREAASMDPQQRLLLEVTWEALEHSGHAPDRLAKSRTGVFVGICGSDYYSMLMDSGVGASNTYLATGTTHSVASGRISYVLGLQGPSMSIDTACSSSLVAIHLACQSLNNDECRMALAGGVNTILSPDATIALSTARMMAPDGRCKAFDARANGFVRAEGCGIIVLKRLSDALADGDRVLAVIEGSAINQDGRSSGLTAPNGPSQVAVVREALERAGVNAADVSYVEAHGTGTSLGDPIEVQALATAMGTSRSADHPLMIGSVKTNIGHLEAAAGVAGLIKVVLALQHQSIPAHLHLQNLNPHIPWSELPVRVSSEPQPWPATSRRIAGVSSFGFSGTNAHVVLADAPAAAPAVAGDANAAPALSQHVCCLSARSATALLAQAERLASHLAQNPELELADVCFTMNEGRAHFAHRAAFLTSTINELEAKLATFAAGKLDSGAISGVAAVAEPPEIAFLFTGQGSQYAGMARALYEAEPVFRDAVNRCSEILGDLTLNTSLLTVLYGGDTSLVNETQFTQPALFAIEYALAQLWISFGIRPSFALGHSIGEYVAACIAGVMSLESVLKLVAARGRLMQALPSGGGMAAILAERPVVERVVNRYPGALAIAAINGPKNIVISGKIDALELAVSELEAQGFTAQRLTVSHAFHSPLLDPMLDDFERIAADVSYSAPQIGLVSNLSGGLFEGNDAPDARYWRRHAREAVDFSGGIRALYNEGCRISIEIGPSPILIGMGKQCVPDSGVAWVPTLRRGAGDWKQVLTGLAELYVRGARIDWTGGDRGRARRRVSLPTYPFEREHYWIEDAERSRHTANRMDREDVASGHALLGAPFESARGEKLYPARISLERQPFLLDHRIHGMYVLPAPVYMELALAAARDSLGTAAATIEDLSVVEPLIVGDDQEYQMQVVVARDSDNGIAVEIFSRQAGSESDPWKKHATARGVVEPETKTETIAMAKLEDLRKSENPRDGRDFYSRLQALGVEFGPRFQGIEKLWRRDGEAAGQIRVPPELSPAIAGYHLHPAVMDSCLQLLGASLPDGGEEAHDENTYLMVGIDRYVLRETPGAAFWCFGRIRDAKSGGELLTGDVFILTSDGREIAKLEGVRLKRARRDALLRGARTDMDRWLYEVQWEESGVAHGGSQSASELPSVERFSEAVAKLAEPLAVENNLDEYQRLVSDLEDLASAYVLRAIESLGWRGIPGETFSSDALALRLGIASRHKRLFGRLLEMFGEDGTFERLGEDWQIARVPIEGDPREMAAAIRLRYPQFDGEVALLETCGEQLSGVLRGNVDPVQLLFPGGSMTAVEKLTQGSPAARAYNLLVRQVVETASKSAGERTFRILEIGAGTGGTTSAVLPALPAGQIEYVFTDVSQLFLSRAEKKFAAYPFVQYRLLDIESDPIAQGFAAHEFDVVIAANVLHATSDLGRTMENVRRVLAPSGLMVLLEGMGAQRWVDLTFGLTEGWWKFSDLDRRPSHPLLPRQGWLQLLADAGFQDANALPSVADGDSRYARQAVVVAKAPDAGATFRMDLRGRNVSRRWLVFGDGGGIANQLVSIFAGANISCTRIAAGSQFAKNGEHEFVLDPTRPGDFDRLFSELPSGSEGAVTEVIDLLSYDSGNGHETSVATVDQEVAGACRSALYLMQALVRARQTLKPKLWLITRAGQPAGLEELQLDVAQSALWGLGRTIANEHPEIWGGMLDVAASDFARAAESIALEVATESNEDQIAFRNGTRYVARLRHSAPPPAAKSLQIRNDRTYLVTGGTGGMGVKVASWLIEKGARHLVLTGRSGKERMSAGELTQLEPEGVQLAVCAADAANDDQMRSVFAEIESTMPPLAGVIHVAGIFDDRVLMGHDWKRFAKVLAPKVHGGWLLHELTKNLQLDFFVLFSSGASFLAPTGLGNYAAGNAFLDSLAHYRRRMGLPGISINWGPWEKVGMAEAVGDRREDQWTQAGFATMTPQQGLAVMERLIAGGAPQTGVLIVDWMKYVERFGNAAPPLYCELTRQDRTAATGTTKAAATVLDTFARALPAERFTLLSEHVRANVIEILGFNANYQLDYEQGLFDLGMDSLTAVELKNRLQNSFGRSLPSTLLFDYPNVQKLSEYLAREVLQWSDAAASAHNADVNVGDLDDRSNMSEDELERLLSQKLAQLS